MSQDQNLEAPDQPARSADMTDDRKTTPSIRMGPDREADAIGWHVRLGSGDATEQDRAHFSRWRAEGDNGTAFADVDRLWVSLGAVLEDMPKVLAFRPRRRLSSAYRTAAIGLAASLLAILGCGYQYVHVWQFDHATQGSSRGFTTLPDGSTVALNTGTALDVHYANGVRTVTLARGEAYFDVRHDPAHPFIVRAGGGEISVLGTAFSVARDGDGGRVVVRRGKVRVRSGKDSVDITPNESVTFAGGGNGAVRAVDAVTDVSWSDGRLFFSDKPLREVIAGLGRYYPGVIILRNDAAGGRRISATIKLDDIDDWFAALARSQHVTVRKLPGVVLIT